MKSSEGQRCVQLHRVDRPPLSSRALHHSPATTTTDFRCQFGCPSKPHARCTGGSGIGIGIGTQPRPSVPPTRLGYTHNRVKSNEPGSPAPQGSSSTNDPTRHSLSFSPPPRHISDPPHESCGSLGRTTRGWDVLSSLGSWNKPILDVTLCTDQTLFSLNNFLNSQR